MPQMPNMKLAYGKGPRKAKPKGGKAVKKAQGGKKPAPMSY